MPRNNKNWSAEAEKRLLELMARGEHRATIARALQRTESAIEGRAHALKYRSDPQIRSVLGEQK